MITPELLRDWLHLPVTTEIVWAGVDYREIGALMIALTVTDPGLPDVELVADERPPLVRPTFRRHAVELSAGDPRRHAVELIAWNP